MLLTILFTIFCATNISQCSRQGQWYKWQLAVVQMVNLSLSVRCLLCCIDRRSANVAVKDFPNCVPAHVQQAVSRQVVVRMGTFVTGPAGRLPVDG